MLEDQLDYCQEMNVHGARGALFKIQLPRYHYTFVAKGTGVECAEDLRHESIVYQHLQPIQGKYIPVHLGETTVPGPLYYAGAVGIVRMMFLSFAGYQIQSPISKAVIEQAIQGLQAIHELGILQKDPATRNILVYPGESRVAWIDFERAGFLPSRKVLGVLSPNRKRKLWPPQEGGRKIQMDFETGTRATHSEINQARAELMKLIYG
jgi:serine/threonine protein kinase